MSTVILTKKLRIACLSTYPPRRCGIATFSADLCDAISDELDDPKCCQIFAINDVADGYDYPQRVRFEIREGETHSYKLAGDFLNLHGIDLLLVQHEYGIFGGDDGADVLDLLREVRIPVMTTMHTVLPDPKPHLAAVTKELIKLSNRVVVMSSQAMETLSDVYDAVADKTSLIHHGIPDMPFIDPSFNKDQFGVEGRKVLLTFGFLSPAKGIEYVIQALPNIVRAHPELVYIVQGATHPNVKRDYGEKYRHSLQHLAADLGVVDHVRFDNRYVDIDELCELLGAADIYVTPYIGKEQTVSGTLSYAMGAGTAIISTPYAYAEEVLADGRGIIVPFRDPDAIAREINGLLEHGDKRRSMRKRAYLYSRQMLWRQVGRSYLNLCRSVISERTLRPRVSLDSSVSISALRHGLPELKLGYLQTLTDDTGIMQHGHYSIPNRRFGYCTDDNARALICALEAYRQTKEPMLLAQVRVHMSFIEHAFNPKTRRFRNFMSYDRQWLDESGSEDSHGRAIWALGVAVAAAPIESVRAAAAETFHRAFGKTVEFKELRPMAFALIGIREYLRSFTGDSEVQRTFAELARRLYKAYEANVTDDSEWVWPDDIVTYDNGKLPHALMAAGSMLQSEEMSAMGLRSLKWLLEIQTDEDNVLSPIGNRGWYPRGGKTARFDQQPLEAHALLEACLEAARIDDEDNWTAEAWKCFNWFIGKNDLAIAVYDYQTGGCHDGLHANGVNGNEGAESTLAWLMSLLAIRSQPSGAAHGSGSKTVEASNPFLAAADDTTADGGDLFLTPGEQPHPSLPL